MGYIVGGWEVSGILTLQSGRPFTALVSKDNANVSASVDRPLVIGDGNAGPKTVQQWINTSAFALAPAGTFGNAGRNNLFAPGFKNLDLVVSNTFPIREIASHTVPRRSVQLDQSSELRCARPNVR